MNTKLSTRDSSKEYLRHIGKHQLAGGARENMPWQEQKAHALAAHYLKSGYRIFWEPNEANLPFDLDGYVPDVMIMKGSKGLIIDFKGSSKQLEVDRYLEIAKEIAKHDGWMFFLITSDEISNEFQIANLPSWKQIHSSASGVKVLLNNKNYNSALLVIWSAFESILRKRAVQQHIPIERFPISSVIKRLYSLGELSMEDSDRLTEGLKVRNSISHGQATNANPKMVQNLYAIMQKLVRDWAS